MPGMHQPVAENSTQETHVTNPTLHILDFEDVALTPEGAKLLHHGARAIMRQFMPAMDSDSLTPAQAVALFIDQVFWEEKSGGLIMCADMPDTSLCLPIPKAHWKLRDDLGYTQ